MSHGSSIIADDNCSLWEGKVMSAFWLSCNRLDDQFGDCKREGKSSGVRDMVTISSSCYARLTGDSLCVSHGFLQFALHGTLPGEVSDQERHVVTAPPRLLDGPIPICRSQS